MEGNLVGQYHRGDRNGVWKRLESEPASKLKENIQYSDLQDLHADKDSSHFEGFREYRFGQLLKSDDDSVFQPVEVLPLFNGCNVEGMTPEQKQACSDKKVLQCVYNNVVYPKKAIRKEIEGHAIVSFLIDKEGKVQNIEVRNGVTKKIKKQLVKVVQEMPEWTPGTKDGEAVNVSFNLPVRFDLS